MITKFKVCIDQVFEKLVAPRFDKRYVLVENISKQVNTLANHK